jgi:hypothetical protein
MTICFRTPGLIDLRAVRTFGVSAKETDGAIGQFGTGLKYAIAVALRHGCAVELWRGLECWRFGTLAADIRNKEFALVTMRRGDDAPMELAFTTELGKHWKPWMAFRELESNTRDERGETFLTDGDAVAREGRTAICVTGMDEEYEGRHKTFLAPNLLAECRGLEVHKGTSDAVYCKGVRVLDLKHPAEFSYNFLSLELTEDRTAKSEHSVFWGIGDRLQDHCANEELLYAIMRNGANTMEGSQLLWPSVETGLSPHFRSALARIAADDELKYVNPGLRTLWGMIKPKKAVGARAPEGREIILIERALAFLRRAGLGDCTYEILIAGELPDHALGMAEPADNRITLSETLMAQGQKQVTATILEEYTHLRTGLKDESYELQTHLFNMVLTQAEMRMQEVL